MAKSTRRAARGVERSLGRRLVGAMADADRLSFVGTHRRSSMGPVVDRPALGRRAAAP
jgi:hypothetical protein